MIRPSTGWSLPWPEPNLATASTVGLVCVVIAIALSTGEMYHHLTHYARPEFQLHVVRILGMVPVYSLTAWISLVSSDARDALLMDVIRDGYEAYVIYNFLALLIQYGGGDRQLVYMLEMKPRAQHLWPLQGIIPPVKLGSAFIFWVRASCLQFVFVKPLGAFLLYYFYGTGKTEERLQIIVTILLNMSVSVALYGLMLFYRATKDILKPFKPFLKFVVVKMVIFFSFWQGVILSAMVRLGILRDVVGYTAKEQATGLQDLLICAEMVVAAICHIFIFSWRDYDPDCASDLSPQSNTHRNFISKSDWEIGRPLLRNFGDIFDIRDVLADAKDTLYGTGFELELRESEPFIPERLRVLDEE